MAKKRTKKDKILAKTHRIISSVELVTVSETRQSAVEVIKPDLNHSALLGYPTKLLYRDLVRSLAITVLLVVLLVGIFFFVQYN